MISLPALKPSFDEEGSRRLLTVLLVLLALACALGWALAARRVLSSPPPAVVPVAAARPVPATLAAADLARLMGAATASAPSEPSPEQRFVVVGVLAGRSGQGAALIAVDGQPAQPFRVGAELAPGWVLKRLAAREVMLAESPEAPVKLTLPLPEWQPRSASGNAPGAAAAAPEGPPPEATSAQPERRGDQRGP